MRTLECLRFTQAPAVNMLACERSARMVSVWDRVPSLDETIEKIDAVTTAKVRDLAGNLCQSPSAAMALYGPVQGAPELGNLTEKLRA